LHAEVHGRARLHLLEAVARVGEDQDAALGLLHRGQLAGPQQERAQCRVRPERRPRAWTGLAGRQDCAQTGSEWDEVEFGERLAVVGREFLQGAECVHVVPPVVFVRSGPSVTIRRGSGCRHENEVTEASPFQPWQESNGSDSIPEYILTMSLPPIDMRLLQVFDEIHKTRSVSRAADNLGLGQPAVSIALGKLRQHYDDPLFVRTSNGMDPTPLGEELVQPVRRAIESLQEALGYRAVFDPTAAERTFRIAMTDISQLVLLPALWATLRRVAPGVRIEVANLSADTARSLEAGEVDLALGFMPQLDAGFYQQALFRQHYVCLVSRHHPRIRGSLSLAQFEAEDHAVVVNSGTGHVFVDKELARQNITRRVAVRLPNFLGVAFVIERTDLLVTIPTRLGEMLAGRGEFVAYPVPFPIADYAVKQHWHERYHDELGNRWLRGVIRDLLGGETA
jgi:DNA-binding transcriptional LysR family regulator